MCLSKWIVSVSSTMYMTYMVAEDEKTIRKVFVSGQSRGLKEGKEVIKVSISDLSTTLIGFLPNLAKTSEKGGRPMKYAYFLTRQGVARLIATRRPHDIKDDPALADWLDRLQDWIYGEVLPEALATGRYSGKPLLAGQHAIDGMPANIADALRMMADEYDAHDLSIKALKEAERTKAQIRDQERLLEEEVSRTDASVSSRFMGDFEAILEGRPLEREMLVRLCRETFRSITVQQGHLDFTLWNGSTFQLPRMEMPPYGRMAVPWSTLTVANLLGKRKIEIVFHYTNCDKGHDRVVIWEDGVRSISIEK